MKKYDLNYNDSPSKRWGFVKDPSYIKMLQFIKRDLKNDGIDYENRLVRFGINAVSLLTRFEEYYKEMEFLGSIFGKTNVAIWNIMYELTQLIASLGEITGLSWCTSGAVFDRHDKMMLHLRNVDWPLKAIKRATILINFHGAPSGDFTAVTFPGYIGVISGVAKGRFSATINMAATDHDIKFAKMPVGLILRRCFEECGTFSEAINFLMNQKVMAPAMIHVVGLRNDKSKVICFKSTGNVILNEVALSNHYPDDWRYSDNYSLMDSGKRHKIMKNGLLKINGYKSAIRLLRKRPIFNEDTVQSMVLVPRTGDVIFNENLV